MLGNTIRAGLIAILFVFGAGAYLVTMVPSGPSIQVQAEVSSRTSKSGPMGNTGVLICKLENGQSITVDIPPIATVRTGDTVFLNSHERYFIGPKYSFAGKLKTAG